MTRKAVIMAAYLLWVWTAVIPALVWYSLDGDWLASILSICGTAAYPLVYKRKE